MKLNEQLLSEKFLSSLINGISDPIFVKDENHVHLIVNDAFCKFFHIHRQDVIGKPHRVFFGKRESNYFSEQDRIVFETGKTVTYEIPYIDKNRNSYTLLTKKSLFVAPDGTKLLVGVVSDISEIKKVHIELENARHLAEEANLAKTRFIANMSHEIRTPLNSIMGFAEYLMLEETSESNREIFGNINESGKVLLKLIDDVLDIAKIESGSIVLERKPLNIFDKLQSIRKRFEPIAKTNNNKVTLTIDPQIIPTVIGDETKLSQIITNLVGNAMKFTKDGQIDISANLLEVMGADRQQIEFRISDTGIGISKEFLPKIFEEFAQEDNGKSRRFSGAGLGLAIVKQFVELMEGYIAVESKIGKGTTFVINIPFNVSEENKTPANAPSYGKIDLQGFRILVGEDNKMSQLLMRKLLERSGCKYTVVDDGQQVVEKLKENKFDLLLIDIHMPVMNGYEAVQIIKKDPGTAKLPIVALTANVVKDDIELIKELGIYYMSKPFNLHKFYELLNGILNKHQYSELLSNSVSIPVS